MRKKPLGILIISFVLCALCTVADTSAFARGGGHGGGGHGGGGHGHGGGGHGHGGGHRGGGFHGHAFGGHRGGHHFAHHSFGGHNFARRRFATHGHGWAGHHVAGHGFTGHRNFTHSGAGHGLTGSRFAAGGRLAHNQFAAQHFHGLSNFSRTGFNRNTFGNGPGWDGWSRSFWGAGWNNWGSGWGGWAGPVFWPFLVGDILSFAFWPYAYYDPFWAFGPDFVLASVFAPGPYYGLGYGYGPNYYVNGGFPNIYSGSYGGPSYGRTNQVAKSLKNREALAETNAAAVQSCSGLAPGITDLPIGQIRQTIHPTAEQVAALDDLSAALSKADEIVAVSCPQEVPLTPVGRLDAAEQRLDAMIQAIQIVRSPLERFDESLNEEQRQHFDAMSNIRRPNSEGVESGGNLATACSQQAGGFINMPVQRVDQVIQPNAQQQDAFDQLKKVSENAVGTVQASCPAQMPRTPTARLDTAKTRLGAMVEAMKAVRPKLEQFYASLNDEQKARFNAIGPPQNPASQPRYQSSGR
jgi:hypothetical protein